MLKAVLIDDEEIALDVLEILLNEIGGICVAGKFQMVSEAADQVELLQPDLIFLDIEMPGMNGLEGGEMLMTRCPDAEIIFVTAYHQYAVEAFEKNAIDYLLKPVAKERLVKTLSRYEGLQSKAAKRVRDLLNTTTDESASAEQVQKFLYLKVLGGLELYGEDGWLVTWRTKKTKELFAYLWSFGGAPVYRYHILDQLWPDIDSERAKTLFHTTIYNLRIMLKALGFPDMVAFGDERYWMQTAFIKSDVDQLEAILQREGGVNTAEELLSLYKGDYLEMDHYQWAHGKRAELRSSYIHYLDLVSGEAVGMIKVQLLQKLVELDPYRVNDYDRLMLLLKEIEDTPAIEKLSAWRMEWEQENRFDM